MNDNLKAGRYLTKNFSNIVTQFAIPSIKTLLQADKNSGDREIHIKIILLKIRSPAKYFSYSIFPPVHYRFLAFQRTSFGHVYWYTRALTVVAHCVLENWSRVADLTVAEDCLSVPKDIPDVDLTTPLLKVFIRPLAIFSG